MINFISNNPILTGWLAFLLLLLIIIIIQQITDQVEKYLKLRYDYYNEFNKRNPVNLEIKKDEKIKLPDIDYN